MQKTNPRSHKLLKKLITLPTAASTEFRHLFSNRHIARVMLICSLRQA